MRVLALGMDGADYDLVACFDCLHDMGDPVGVARRIRQVLKPDGTFMIVEPFANDDLEDNLNPVGRVYYAASTLVCTPASKAVIRSSCPSHTMADFLSISARLVLWSASDENRTTSPASAAMKTFAASAASYAALSLKDAA